MRSSRSAILGSFALLLGVLSGCEPEAPPPETPAQPTSQPTATPTQAPEAKKPAFENPGGMWMPEQIPPQADKLKELGLEIDPAALSDPMSGTLGAVVSLGGCSASFVSDEGLVITNHHCSVGALQYNSTAKEPLLTEGYLARTRADEKSNGPSARVYVTQKLTDVTHDVTDGLAAITDDAARYRKVEDREKSLVAACEKDRPTVRCSVAKYFGGAQYRLIEQLEIKDVRLVFAPHDQIGDYGGEIDNWHWPRHSGDVAMFRAYVGKDGKPAPYSPDNVPYHPPHHLKIFSKPLTAGDLVMVAGYPGVTNRLRTAAEADDATSFVYPTQIQIAEEAIALLDKQKERGEDIKQKATPLWRGLNNAKTKWKGIVEGLVKGGFLAQKAKSDADLKAWIDADPSRKAAFGDVLDKIKAHVEHTRTTRAHDMEVAWTSRLVSLFNAANTLVRMAEERAKPDAERDPAFQQRNWDKLAQAQEQVQKRYDRAIDQALFKLMLERALRLPEKERPAYVGLVLGKGKGKIDDKRLESAIDALYKKSTLEDAAERVKLLKTATIKDLEKSKDPMIQLALKMRPVFKAVEEREKAEDGAMLLLRPRYIEALQKMTPGPLAPDANGTLRITYGTVRGYRPTPQAELSPPFTTVSQMVKKKGPWPFDVPGYVLDTVKAGKFGPYVDANLGEVPVDFLSDLDITGGNSGSPTLNARGEIVGLAFDGNYEAMASDWLFVPSLTRTIHVDMRYVLWLLDAVYHGQHLVKEMGGKPAF